MSPFSQKVNFVVSKIPQGKFLTYKEVVKKAGSSRAFRAVGSIMKKNTNPKVPCHRVIKSDYSVGSFGGRKENFFLKAGLLLKEGAIGVIPTDTIYGIIGSALNKNTVKAIYKLKKRDPKKPMIILISDIKEIEIFGIKLNNKQKNLLEKFWPGKVSIIFDYFFNKFFYLHRGTNVLAFRLPEKRNFRHFKNFRTTYSAER